MKHFTFLLSLALFYVVAFSQTNHGGNIASNETWLAAGNPHVITSVVTVNAGVVLTIEDGCEVRSNYATYLSVIGTLNATGTAGNGILFTRNGTAQWGGLRYQSGSTGTLEYCTVEHAIYGTGYAVYANNPSFLTINNCILQNNDYGFQGNNANPTITNTLFQDNTTSIYFLNTTAPEIGAGNTFVGDTYGFYFNNCTNPIIPAGTTIENNTSAGIRFTDCPSLGTIDNLVMNNNGGYGAFWFEDCGAVTLGNNITYSGNEWPLSMDIKTFLDETSTIPASGNTNNDIRIVGGTLGGAATWHYFPGVDYIITAIPTISASGSLSINDGNTVRFDYGKYFTVNGTLNATGTSGNGILFTRNGTAQWGGLRYYSGSTGTLEYCTVEHAIYGTGYAIFANDPASLTINN